MAELSRVAIAADTVETKWCAGAGAPCMLEECPIQLYGLHMMPWLFCFVCVEIRNSRMRRAFPPVSFAFSLLGFTHTCAHACMLARLQTLSGCPQQWQRVCAKTSGCQPLLKGVLAIGLHDATHVLAVYTILSYTLHVFLHQSLGLTAYVEGHVGGHS